MAGNKALGNLKIVKFLKREKVQQMPKLKYIQSLIPIPKLQEQLKKVKPLIGLVNQFVMKENGLDVMVTIALDILLPIQWMELAI